MHRNISKYSSISKTNYVDLYKMCSDLDLYTKFNIYIKRGCYEKDIKNMLLLNLNNIKFESFQEFFFQLVAARAH